MKDDLNNMYARGEPFNLAWYRHTIVDDDSFSLWMKERSSPDYPRVNHSYEWDDSCSRLPSGLLV